MNRSIRIRTFAVLLASCLWTTLAGANAWELMIQLSGPNSSAMQIRVCETATGHVVGTYMSNAYQGANDFTVDFNNTGGADVSLPPGVQYTLTFVGWNKSCYIEGDMPPNQTNYDDTWSIDGNTNVVTHVSGPLLQEVSGFPGATCGAPPPPFTLQLTIDSMTRIGDKVVYKLRGTASGGTGGGTLSCAPAPKTTRAALNPSPPPPTILHTPSHPPTLTPPHPPRTGAPSIFLGGGRRSNLPALAPP